MKFLFILISFIFLSKMLFAQSSKEKIISTKNDSIVFLQNKLISFHPLKSAIRTSGFPVLNAHKNTIAIVSKQTLRDENIIYYLKNNINSNRILYFSVSTLTNKNL